MRPKKSKRASVTRAAKSSKFVRAAIQRSDEAVKGSFANVAGDAIGSLSGGPGDLATNPRHLKNFGR